MRRQISWAVAVFFAVGAAHAQEEFDDPTGESASEAAESEATETEGIDVSEPPPGRPGGDTVRMTEGARTSAPGETHTVVTGDTLWDLSQRYLGSPWYWPKVWSYNPEIANPHWIYPGNLVRFFPQGEEVPTQVEVGEGPPEEVAEEVMPGEMFGEEAPPVQVTGKIGYTPTRAMRIRQVGFVTEKELDESGVIDSSFAETDMLSFPDTAYISFKRKSDARVGDRYLIFKTLDEVKHPEEGSYGYLTKMLGTMRVVSISDELVTARIEDTWDEIFRGDRVGPYNEQVIRSVEARPNDRELKGFVIGTLEPSLTLFGEHTVVIVDKGARDGVQVGNTFDIIRQHEGHEGFMEPARANKRYPVENIATCMAIDVKDRATTCLMTRSLREVVWGDRIHMRPQPATGVSMR